MNVDDATKKAFNAMKKTRKKKHGKLNIFITKIKCLRLFRNLRRNLDEFMQGRFRLNGQEVMNEVAKIAAFAIAFLDSTL